MSDEKVCFCTCKKTSECSRCKCSKTLNKTCNENCLCGRECMKKKTKKSTRQIKKFVSIGIQTDRDGYFLECFEKSHQKFWETTILPNVVILPKHDCKSEKSSSNQIIHDEQILDEGNIKSDVNLFMGENLLYNSEEDYDKDMTLDCDENKIQNFLDSNKIDFLNDFF